MHGSSFGQGYGFGITVMTETPEIERTGLSLRSWRNLLRSSFVAAAKISEFLSGRESPNCLETSILARASPRLSLISPLDIPRSTSLQATEVSSIQTHFLNLRLTIFP
jgi:hypothetical protein